MSKTILISGGSRNLGQYIAKKFINKKFNVINLSRSRGQNIFDNYFFYKCDLSNNGNVKKIFKNLSRKFKNIDLIINCSGNSKKEFLNFETYKNWISSFNSNFFSFTNLLDNYLKYYSFKKTKIIVISSIAANKIIDAPITYSVSKCALSYYSKIKAKQLAKYKININVISPGNILMNNNNWHKKIKKNKIKIQNYIKKNVPLRKFSTPDEIFNMCEYLFSASGDNITGSNFILDGGQSL
jgi:3-oxoacyl-[acyl-carrier protein] reductase